MASDPVQKTENAWLRWLNIIMLGLIGTLGGMVWKATSDQVTENTKTLRDHDLKLQRLELDAVADRRATAMALQNIQGWLQAIGQRMNVSPPPPVTHVTNSP